ncbi:MAG: hypothetical protein JW969_06375 [Spirochaetales bacterium]|nr:hypothetical protein [Spirochaetales bacterium]
MWIDANSANSGNTGFDKSINGKGFYYLFLSLLLAVFFLVLSPQSYLFSQHVKVRLYDPGILNINENQEARTLFHEIIVGSLSESENGLSATIRQKEDDRRVRVQSLIRDGNLFYLFLNEEKGKFSLDTIGNYSIKRDIASGDITGITVLIRNDKLCFLRVYPNEDRSKLDLFLFGTLLYHDVVLPLPIKDLLTLPFQKLIDFTADTIDWNQVLYKGGTAEDIWLQKTTARIESLLPGLADAEDGAQNEYGEYVFIKDGAPQKNIRGFNCSGFAKWIVDGFYYPLTGSYMNIESLKKRQLPYRGSDFSRKFETSRDPYFGLDWSRSLAVALEETETSEKAASPEEFDVRQVDFFKYVEDVGYPATQMQLILFLLAQEDPGRIYLGSVNREVGTTNQLRQHTHIAVFFPYFTKEGYFIPVVMERIKKTTITAFTKRHLTDNIHLVWIKPDVDFYN